MLLDKKQIREMFEAEATVKGYDKKDREENILELIQDGNKQAFQYLGHTVKVEEDFGGGEGSGEERWIVFSVSKDGQTDFWQLPGFYASHYGSEFQSDEIFRVKQEEQKVFVWTALEKGES